MLGDKVYDSAELRQWLSERGTNPSSPTSQIASNPSASTGNPKSNATSSRTPSAGSRTFDASQPDTKGGKKLPCFRFPGRSYRVVDFISVGPSLKAVPKTPPPRGA
jgi:hypothetical protein